MEIFSELNKNNNLSISLGYFDGVHIGHRKVIKDAVDYAKRNSVKSAVITFTDHPCCYLWNVKPKYILSRAQRQKKIEDLGVDYLYELDFSTLSNLNAREYLENVIIKYFSPKAIFTGFNHHFGINKSGDAVFLRNNALQYKYKFFMSEPVLQNNEIISSTIIRKYLAMGNIKTANEMLGYNFPIEGFVQEGQKIGRTIGFRTANITYPHELIELPYGVYLTKVFIGDKAYFSVTNIGKRPTVSKSDLCIIENHILNFNENIYNQKIRVEFLEYLRKEIKFDSITGLKNQIQKDVSSSMAIIKNLKNL